MGDGKMHQKLKQLQEEKEAEISSSSEVYHIGRNNVTSSELAWFKSACNFSGVISAASTSPMNIYINNSSTHRKLINPKEKRYSEHVDAEFSVLFNHKFDSECAEQDSRSPCKLDGQCGQIKYTYLFNIDAMYFTC